MADARQSILPLNPLLFWQVCFLCFLSGILATVWFVESLCFLAVIILLDSRFYPFSFQLLFFKFSPDKFSTDSEPVSKPCPYKHANKQIDCNNSEFKSTKKLLFSKYLLKYFISPLHQIYLKISAVIKVTCSAEIICSDILIVGIRVGLALGSCILGFFIAHYAMPNLPVNTPQWIVTDSGKAKYVRWQGVVERVQYLPDNRLRIIINKVQGLDNISQNKQPPNTGNKSETDSILPGKLIWTWQNASTEPLVGEIWEVSSKIYSLQSFMNFGLSNISFISHAQSIFWRAYTFENKGGPKKALHSPQADIMELTRHNLQNKFLTALSAVEFWGDKKEDMENKQFSVKNEGNSNNNILTKIQSLNQAQAALPALLFGDRRAISVETFNLLSRASLIHSLAISGQHLAVTVLFASLIVFIVAYIYPDMFLFLPRTNYVILFALPLAAIYLWLGGAPSSLQRATCMMFLLAFFLLGNKNIISIDILIIAILCLVILWPFSIFELGLQLSALCIASIILISPLLRKISYSYKYNLSRQSPIYSFHITLAQVAIISLSIQVAMAPYLLLIFGSVSPWFFLNVLWLPILGIIVLPLTVLALILLIFDLNFLASLSLKLASLPCELLFNFLYYLDDIDLLKDHIFLRPHWLGLLGFALLLIALSMTFARDKLPKAINRFIILGAILICTAVFLRYGDALSSRIKISMLDVGQGQSILIDAYGREKVLIDGGGFFSHRFDVGRSIVSKVLTYNSKPFITYIINSHSHIDHFKGLLYIVEYFGFDSYIYSSLPEQEEYLYTLLKYTKDKELKQLAYGDKIILTEKPHKLIFEVLYPLEKYVVKSANKKYDDKERQLNQNNSSLVLRLVEERIDDKGNIYRHGLALIMGDLEDEGIKHLLNSGSHLQADILVVPHHGSKNSYSPELYKAVSPKIALISYSSSNNFGFPGLAVINALRNDNVDVYTTAIHGSVEIIFRGGKYMLRKRKEN